MKGLVLAGTASGVGKTIATLATVQALSDAGKTVQPAKAGPDFIDPSHHATVADRPSRTLDGWLQGEEGLGRNYYRGTGDICVVEGVMGLYDGDVSSTATVAETLDLPVVLVVDGSASMESVAATAHGFREFADEAGRDIDVVGVIAQRTHGGRHARGIREALPDGLAYAGRVPPREDLTVPERHLGLHMGEDAPLDRASLAAAAEHIDTDTLLSIARAPPAPEPTEGTRESGASESAGSADTRVAVARDDAFCFLYPAVLDRLESRATVETFAPTEGDDLPDCDGVYLPGGYPELHAGTLAESPALATIAERASDGLPVLGECGGLMALGESLTTTDGETHAMAGVLPVDVEMQERYQALDHVELSATTDTLTAGAGQSRRGHEFHYSSASVPRDGRFAFEMERGDGIDGDHDGLTEYRTLGTYAHVHAESGAFDTFLQHVQ